MVLDIRQKQIGGTISTHRGAAAPLAKVEILVCVGFLGTTMRRMHAEVNGKGSIARITLCLLQDAGAQSGITAYSALAGLLIHLSHLKDVIRVPQMRWCACCT